MVAMLWALLLCLSFSGKVSHGQAVSDLRSCLLLICPCTVSNSQRVSTSFLRGKEHSSGLSLGALWLMAWSGLLKWTVSNSQIQGVGVCKRQSGPPLALWEWSWVLGSWSLLNSPILMSLGFPWGLAGKESAFNVGDLGSIPGMGRSPGEGKGYPLQYSGLENSMAV